MLSTASISQMKRPPYKTFPILSDGRITLRQIELSDINEIIEISFYDAVKAASRKEAMEMQDKIRQDYNRGNSIHWGIIDNNSGKIVGTCGYYRGFDKQTGELGCVLLPAYRGQGFMNAAMQLAITFGSNTIGLKQVSAITANENLKARNLLQRLNFTEVQKLTDGEIAYSLKL